jgi:iron complex transport system substrate-binding protein
MSAPRVVSLIASATEIVGALGFVDALVGRSHECDYPPEVLRLPICTRPKFDVSGTSAEIDARVRALARSADAALSVYDVDGNLLESLAPDVVVTQTQCEVCADSLRDVEAALAARVRSRPALVTLAASALVDV